MFLNSYTYGVLNRFICHKKKYGHPETMLSTLVVECCLSLQLLYRSVFTVALQNFTAVFLYAPSRVFTGNTTVKLTLQRNATFRLSES